LASYYAEPYHGRKTSNGETFDSYKDMTAAHRTLPYNTLVRVTNQNNGQSVDVRINDRGPFVNGRVIDLSYVAARKIDMIRAGVVPVKLTVLKEGDGSRVSSVEPLPPGAVYAVQVGAFENRQSAEDLKNRLERKYTAVSIQTYTDQVTVYRVRIGREPDMASAQRLALQLRKDDLSTFVVRVN
jgi:rare lipoprotein A